MSGHKHTHIGAWIVVALLVMVGIIYGIYRHINSDTGVAIVNPTEITDNAEIIDIYFTDLDATTLKSEKVAVQKKENTETVRSVMDALLAGPLTTDCKRIIPEGTKLLDVQIDDASQTVTVDLSADYYKTQEETNILSAYSIVKTLCGLENIESVNILIEGEPVVGPSNAPLGILNLEDVVFDNPTTNKSTVSVTLYFADKDMMYLNQELRTVEVTDSEPIEKFVITELIAGPKADGLIATLPQGTKLKSIETTKGICFVNLSDTFATANMGSLGEQMAIYSIVNSLTELTHIQEVQILIDGKKSLGHYDISEPFERNISIIKP